MFIVTSLWILLVLSSLFEIVFCSGIVEIRLIKYINSGGVGSNGHCCDGRGPFCFTDCDHKFKICIDNADGPDNIHSCPYYRRDTGEITNSNTVTFGSSIAGVPNPIKIFFESWPGELKLKVEVWDVDDNSNDHVDFLSGVFGLKASRSETEAAVTAFQIRKRTLLTYNVRVYCDEFYYGEYCDMYCKPSDGELGHYTCDSATGIKICKEGWFGHYCDENDVNECLSSPCNNSRTCIDTTRGYYCECPEGLQGPDCLESVNATCTNTTCQNGGICELIRGHVVCDCPYGFIGLKCEMEFDVCNDIKCENNGTCVTNIDTFYCECDLGFIGTFCEHKLELDASDSLQSSSNTTSSIISDTSESERGDITTISTVDGRSAVVERSTDGNINSTTSSVTPTTPVKQEVTTRKKEINTLSGPVLTVRGKIDKHNQDAVGKGIRDLLYDLMTIKEQLYLNLKYKVETTDEGDIVSKITIASAKDGDHAVNNTLLQHIFDETPLIIIEKHLQMPVVRQDPVVAHSHENNNPHDNSFMHDYWYVVVIIVLVVVCLIIAVGLFILYKHKTSVPENKEEVPRQNPGITEPTSSQSFENTLYFEYKKNNNKSNNDIKTDYTAMP